jgi:hypothetical protein
VLIDRGADVIDTTMLVEDRLLHRFSKQESLSADSSISTVTARRAT